jgi:predicted RNase H-like HicB family nuclease
MYRLWYWALIERGSGGRFIARLYDLPDLVADGATESEAIAGLKLIGNDRIRRLSESGSPLPRASRTSEIPSSVRTKEFSRVLISVDIARALARPGAKYNLVR